LAVFVVLSLFVTMFPAGAAWALATNETTDAPGGTGTTVPGQFDPELDPELSTGEVEDSSEGVKGNLDLESGDLQLDSELTANQDPNAIDVYPSAISIGNKETTSIDPMYNIYDSFYVKVCVKNPSTDPTQNVFTVTLTANGEWAEKDSTMPAQTLLVDGSYCYDLNMGHTTEFGIEVGKTYEANAAISISPQELQNSEWSKTNNDLTMDVYSPYPEEVMSDLGVSDIYLNADGAILVKVINNGMAILQTSGYYAVDDVTQRKAGHTKIYINGELKYDYNWEDEKNAGHIQTFLYEGGEMEYMLQGGDYSGADVKVVIDSENSVYEYDETNNELEAKLLPDLVVKDVYLVKAELGEEYDTLAFKLANEGHADVTAESGLITWGVYVKGSDMNAAEPLNNGGYDWANLSDTNFLLYKQSTVIDSVAVDYFTRGDVAKICVDSKDEVGEIAELSEDNCLEKQLEYRSTNPFPDVDESTLEGQAVLDLYNRGIVKGYPDGTFKGENDINRIEALKMLIEGAKKEAKDSLSSRASNLSDLQTDQWYSKYVGFALGHGIVRGYPDGTFKPLQTVNKAEWLKMFALTFGLTQNLGYSFLDVSADDYFAPYAGLEPYYNLMLADSAKYLNPGENLTRYDVAVALYQYYQATEE